MRKLPVWVFVCVVLAGCTPSQPASTVAPAPTDDKLVTRADVEYADTEVRAAAKYLSEVCPPDEKIEPGNEVMCPLDPETKTPKGDLADAVTECNRLFELYNTQVKDSQTEGGLLVRGVTDNTQSGGKITCAAP